VEDVNTYSVVKLKEKRQNGVLLYAITVNKTPLGAFIESELRELKIPIKYSFYSYYGNKDLYKVQRSVFIENKKK
jgi:hypothetical protein